MKTEQKGITEEVIESGKHLKLVNIKWTNTEGKERKWEAARRVMPGGKVNTGAFDHIVVIVPITDDTEFIFISQFRATVGAVLAKGEETIDGSKIQVIEFPAGVVEKYHDFEDIVHTAQSELQEEAGYAAEAMVVINTGPISAGMSFEYETAFAAFGLTEVPKKDGEEERGISIYKVKNAEAMTWLRDMESRGCVVDAKVRGLMFLAQECLESSRRR